MPLLRDDDVFKIVEFLKSKRAFVYHACQLQDLQSYVRLGGIPARSLLESNSLPFTGFTSDQGDKSKEVWNKVFFNFSDFGFMFHDRGAKGTPCVYGPICLKFDPDVLLQARDISVTLASVSDPAFNRTRDSLCLDDAKKIYRGNYPLNGKLLQDAFPGQKVTNPEINVHYESDVGSFKAQFDSLVEVIVDPVSIGGIDLMSEVKAALTGYDPRLEEFLTSRKTTRPDLFRVLCEVAARGPIYNLVQIDTDLFKGHEEWFEAVKKIGFNGYMLRNYLNYLHEGTIQPLLRTSSEKAVSRPVRSS